MTPCWYSDFQSLHSCCFQCDIVVGFDLHLSRQSNKSQQETYRCTNTLEWFILTSSLLFTAVQGTPQQRQFSSWLWRNRILATKQVPLQHPNIQINLSQVLRLPPSSEWPTSSHPMISLSALRQMSLTDTEICSGCLCRSPLWRG